MRLTSLALYSSLIAAAAGAHIHGAKSGGGAALIARDSMTADATNAVSTATNGALQLLQTAEGEVKSSGAGAGAGSTGTAAAAQETDDGADAADTQGGDDNESMPATDEDGSVTTGGDDGQGDTAADPNAPSDGQLDRRDPHKKSHHRSNKHRKGKKKVNKKGGDKKKNNNKAQPQHQAEPKKQNQQGGAGGQGQYHGKATYFNPGLGACGGWNGGNDKIVALSGDVYHGGSHCGKDVRVCRNGKCSNAKVVDLCPGCHPTSLDLSPSLFSELAPISLGLVDITWNFI